jgi:hypothetical protein
MSTPYIGFGNDTLAKLPIIEEGEEVPCNGCPGMHPLRCGKDEHGEKSSLLMFYRCPATGKSYLGAVAGKLVMFKKPDVSGSL